MIPTVEAIPLKCRTTKLDSRIWRLAARLLDLVRRRLSTLDPEGLTPHLRRDLGFSDTSTKIAPMAPRDLWLR